MRTELSAVVPAPIEEVFDFLDDPANTIRLNEHVVSHLERSDIVETLPDGRRTVDLHMRRGNQAWVQTIRQVIRERPGRLVSEGGTWTTDRNDLVLAIRTDRRLASVPSGTRLDVTIEGETGRPSLLAHARLLLQGDFARVEFEHGIQLLVQHFASAHSPER
jgi:hypothetical protein